MNKGLIKFLTGVIVLLIIAILGLVWWFVFKPENKLTGKDSIEVLEKEALDYFNNYDDIYAARLIVDYYKKNEDTIIFKEDYEKALLKNKYYNDMYGNKMNVFFDFLKDKTIIKTAEDMDIMLDIIQEIYVQGEDVLYALDQKIRSNLLKGYNLINKMDSSRQQKALDDFKKFYLTEKLSDYELYVLYLYVIYRMNNLLGHKVVSYNNEEITFSEFLSENGITNKYFMAIDNFYKDFNIEEPTE